MADWIAIKTEYISTTISQRKLAEKHKVSFDTLKDKANREKWTQQRKSTHNKITTRTQQKIEDIQVEKSVKKAARIEDLTQVLLENLETAVGELNQYNQLVVKKTKTKTVKLDKKGKPQKEITVEQEEKALEVYYAGIKVDCLKMLSASLKDLQNIQMTGAGSGTGKSENNLLEAIARSGKEELNVDDIPELQ